MNRRHFLKSVGIGAASSVVPNVDNDSNNNDIDKIRDLAVSSFLSFVDVSVQCDKLTTEDADIKIASFMDKISDVTDTDTLIDLKYTYDEIVKILLSDTARRSHDIR